MELGDLKMSLAPYLGCSTKLIELFAIIGYDEETLNRCLLNINKNQDKLDLTFLSIVTSDLPYAIADDYIIKQVYPDKPSIIKSGRKPNPDCIIFSTCIDTPNGESKIYNSCFALRFYEKIESKKGEMFYVPKSFLIYSQFPYFTTFYRICDKVLVSTDERYQDKDFPIEIFIHCFVNYFPSPINFNMVFRDFVPNIIIPKLTGYPYVDFNLGKVLSCINLIDFIKIYIIIFLEQDLLLFSPNLEKLNIFMFALYILNYPLTDSNYFWHIKTISLQDIKSGEGDDTVSTSFKGVNTELNSRLDLSDFKALNFIVDLENKKQPLLSISESNDAREMNLLLKYITGICNRNYFLKKSIFLEEYILKLHKNLKNILKEYENIALNDSNVNDMFFYMNKSTVSINRKIQEEFYDFVLNVLVELNKDYSFDSSLKNPVVQKVIDNPRLTEEEKIFLRYSRETIKYNTYFNNFINDFKVYDGLKVSLLFSDEFVNIKKQENFKAIEDKIKYFDILDKLYFLKNSDLIYNLKALDTEYSKKTYIAKTRKTKELKTRKLFSLDREIIKKFIYKKKNKGYYEKLKDPKDLIIDKVKKSSLSFIIQHYLSMNGLLKEDYYLNGSALTIIALCFPFISKEKAPGIIEEYLKTSKKIVYCQRHYIFMLMKSIKKNYVLNKEKGTFPELVFDKEQKYYQIIQNFLKENSIIQDEEIFLFFKKNFGIKEEEKEEIEEEFAFKYLNSDFEKDVFNKVEISPNEISLKQSFKILVFKKMKEEDIPKIFQELGSYYNTFFINNIDVKNFEVNKICEKMANLLMFLKKYKEEMNISQILFYLVFALSEFQKQLSNYQKNNEANI